MGEALQTVFSLEERVILRWNGLDFPLLYRYDLGVMVDDVVELVLRVADESNGSLFVAWPSSGFPYSWSVQWADSRVEVVAKGRDEPGVEDLTGRDRIQVERGHFLRAWQGVLANVLSCLESSGYSREQLEGWSRLTMALEVTGRHNA